MVAHPARGVAVGADKTRWHELDGASMQGASEGANTRHASTGAGTAARHAGTLARWHAGTMARWHANMPTPR